MQKQHYTGKKVKYNVNERSPAAAEELHLERRAAGELSHEGEHVVHHKAHRMHHKRMEAERVTLVEPTEPTSGFSWKNQAQILGDGVGLSQRVRARAQVVANGFA